MEFAFDPTIWLSEDSALAWFMILPAESKLGSTAIELAPWAETEVLEFILTTGFSLCLSLFFAIFTPPCGELFYEFLSKKEENLDSG